MQLNKKSEPPHPEMKANEIPASHLQFSIQQRLSIKIAIVAIFSALAIGASYILAPLINIELLSVLIFTAGFLYGMHIGVLVGLISSVVYYGWNPFGFSPLPMYITTVALMTFIGFLGGFMNQDTPIPQKIEITKTNIFKIALIGLFYTILFDILTNIIIAYIYYGGNILFAFIYGSPFIAIHIISNTLIFAGLVFPIHNTVVTLR
jgi:LytS/YehU family sensor histidine kinase